MKKIRTFAIFISLFLLAFNASLVFAAPHLSLHIVVEETISGTPVSETFTASGTAVATGLICVSGDVIEIGGTAPINSGGPFQTFWVTKQFKCGTDTFDVEMFVRLNTATGYTKAKWEIVGGTGAYTNLQGKGRLKGTPITLGVSILDVYDGKVY